MYILRRLCTIQVSKRAKVPAQELNSDIDGFQDWSLGMVRDFISCMDRARRKYTQPGPGPAQMTIHLD